MKILYVDQTGQLGGGELSLLDWLREKPKDAHVVLFEDGPFRPLLEKMYIPVSILPLGSLKKMRRESMLTTAFRTLPAVFLLSYRLFRLSANFDLIYANSQKAFLVAALGRRRGQPLIWHLRDVLTRDHFSAFLLRIAVSAGNYFATSIIANSDATAASFVKLGGRREKVTVIPDGVDSAIFDTIDLKRAAELRRLLCPDVPFVIGFLAGWRSGRVSTFCLRPSATFLKSTRCLWEMPSSGNGGTPTRF
jgi:hypothetical protein